LVAETVVDREKLQHDADERRADEQPVPGDEFLVARKHLRQEPHPARARRVGVVYHAR
jgi:hypothetical protein